MPAFLKNSSHRLFINKINQNTAIFCHQAMQMVEILEIPDQCAKCSRQTFKCQHKLLFLYCYYKKWTLFYQFSHVSTHQAACKCAIQSTFLHFIKKYIILQLITESNNVKNSFFVKNPTMYQAILCKTTGTILVHYPQKVL